MLLPGALAGCRVAVAGPAGPLAEAVADAAGRAGAAVVLCGHDVDSLDELAWDLAERRDAPVEILAWEGGDAGAGLRAALAAAGQEGAALVLLGGGGWTPAAAAAWEDGRGAVVVLAQPGEEEALRHPGGAAVVLSAPADTAEEILAAWAVFLLTPAGRRAAGQGIVLNAATAAVTSR